MNQDSPDTRDRGKGWNWWQRSFQYTCTFGCIFIVYAAAFLLLSSEIWMRGLFHR